MISPARLDELAAAARTGAMLADLRARFPELHFTVCSEDDVSPRHRPVADAGTRLLYLVAGADGHCLALTDDPAIASGVLLADKDGDDD